MARCTMRVSITSLRLWVMHAPLVQDEIAEMKRKFKIMNHQIEQLKEEIQVRAACP